MIVTIILLIAWNIANTWIVFDFIEDQTDMNSSIRDALRALKDKLI